MRTPPLWRRAREQTAHALASGSLGPIGTRVEMVPDEGVEFSVRVVESLAAKDRAAERRAPSEDPFLPYDEDLYVGPAGDDHVLLLNKFPVVTDHLLLVTRAFEDQEAQLTPRDFEALFSCTDFAGVLAFYNAGEVAGASQRHKHLQLVRVDALAAGRRVVPTEPLARRGALPFAHARRARPDDPAEAHARYARLLREVGCEAAPYNVLITADLLLVIPRTRPGYEGIPVNAMGFAGSILVRDDRLLERVRRIGPMTLLRRVARPR